MGLVALAGGTSVQPVALLGGGGGTPILATKKKSFPN